MQIIRNFISQNRGNVVIEFALVLPVLVSLLIGTFELTMYVLLHNKLTRIAGTLNNVVTVQNLTREKLQAILGTADTIAQPFDFTANGRMVISQIQNEGATDDANNMMISWQESSNGGVSKLGAPGDAPNNVPGDLEVTGSQTIVVAEVFYNYTPFFIGGFLQDTALYKATIYVPRRGTMNSLLGEDGG